MGHLEAFYRELKGKVLSDPEMEYITAFESVNGFSFLGS